MRDLLLVCLMVTLFGLAISCKTSACRECMSDGHSLNYCNQLLNK